MVSAGTGEVFNHLAADRADSSPDNPATCPKMDWHLADGRYPVNTLI